MFIQRIADVCTLMDEPINTTMQKIFNNILLPVHINSETDHVVEKAIEFANRLECNLHILYTTRTHFLAPSIFRFKTPQNIKVEKQRRLAELQNRYCRSLKKGLLLFISFRTGNPEKETAAYAVSHEIDMVYIMEEESRFPLFRKRFNINRLAGLANCA